ncbi:hypothetical protein AX16_002995 [Volvariella volvacea WC 439]|nr:hypothetical protein AX16_002995 [Volvariella volvacea WC 439]
MSDTTPAEPRLPQDLERAIFEFAALNDRRSIPLLMRVARRIRIWLEPIHYETVILRTTYLNPSPNNAHLFHEIFKPPSSYVHHIRHLSIPLAGNNDQLSTFVSQCANIQNLQLSGNIVPAIASALITAIRSPNRTVSPKGLLRFSGSLYEVFRDTQVDFNHEAFKDLTHLDLAGNVVGWKEGNNYACLKNLRYVSFPEVYQGLGHIVAMCLRYCEALEAVIVFSFSFEENEAFEDELPKVRNRLRLDGTMEEIPEDRVVFLYYDKIGYNHFSWIDDWIRGATGGIDMWKIAEEIIQERRWKRERLL